MIDQTILKKQSFSLDNECNTNLILKQQISKEAEIDQSFQFTINQKIDMLKQNAILLAKKLQNQKHKHNQLEILVKYIRNEIDLQKIDEATHKNDINFDSLVSLQNKQKKYQTDLSHISNKVNKLLQNVYQKRAKINQLRTERVIDSSIFRNLQKQLINSQIYFKKLLIQKITQQRLYQKLNKQYLDLKIRAQNYQNIPKQTNRQNSNREHSHSKNNSSIQNIYDDKSKKKFTQLKRSNGSTIVKKIINKSNFVDTIDENLACQKQQKILMIHKLMSFTYLNDVEQLLNYLKNIDNINDNIYNQINNLNSKCNQIQQFLKQSKKITNKNKPHYYDDKKQLTKNQIKYYKYIELTEKKNEIQKQNIQKLIDLRKTNQNQQFKKLLKLLDIKQNIQNIQDVQFYDYITDLFKQIQLKINNYLVKDQNIQKDLILNQKQSNGKLQEIINRVPKYQQCQKVLNKNQFQEQYKKLMRNNDKKKSMGPRMSKQTKHLIKKNSSNHSLIKK